MLTDEQLTELYGGPLREETVKVSGSGWINTPAILVDGEHTLPVVVQGGIHSEYAQLSHIVRRWRQSAFPVIALSQSGAKTVTKQESFYDCGDYSRFVARDREVLDRFEAGKVISYGSSIGATASSAFAAEHQDSVAAVIAVNPASLFRQNPRRLVFKFVLSNFQHMEKDFVPPPTSSLSLRRVMKELRRGVAQLAASDIGIRYLERVKCPVLIYTGNEDDVFPGSKLKKLDQLSHVQVIPMVGFIHSDPNSRNKADRLIGNAIRELGKLGIT